MEREKQLGCDEKQATAGNRRMLETLHGATRRYKLRDPNVSNTTIAECLNADCGDGDFKGSPACCFFSDGYVAAIRTKTDELVIFHLFGMMQARVADIASRNLD
ncbi:MAG: hypothetical protein Q7S50_04450 [bacterium]|nr:hypothetical protein [bacterium]